MVKAGLKASKSEGLVTSIVKETTQVDQFSPGAIESAAAVATIVFLPRTYVHAGVAEDMVGLVPLSKALPN